MPPTSLPPSALPPPHVCISGGVIDDLHDPNNDEYDDDDDDEENMENDDCQMHLNEDNLNVMDAELNNDPFMSMSNSIHMNSANNNLNNTNHYMNVSSTINLTNSNSTNDYYQNVMQLQNGDNV